MTFYKIKSLKQLEIAERIKYNHESAGEVINMVFLSTGKVFLQNRNEGKEGYVYGYLAGL